MRLKGKKVLFKEFDYIPDVGEPVYKYSRGIFIQFGTSFEIEEDIPYGITTAIIISDDGKLQNIPVELIQFIGGKYGRRKKSKTKEMYLLQTKNMRIDNQEERG